MTDERQRWVDSGGDLSRLARAERVGSVAVFSDGNDRISAGVHPSHAEIGTLWDHTGSPALLLDAEAWLRARGCRVARGPMELCSFLEHRANLGPFDDEPFASEPTEPAAPWERGGYAPAARWAVALAEHDAMIDAASDRAGALATAGFTVRPLPLDLGEGRASEAAFKDAVTTLHAIASATATDAYGFAPVPVDVLYESLAPRRLVVDPRLVMIARGPDRSPAGILFGLPDSKHPRRGWFVATTLVVLPKYRQTGLGAWLVAAVHKAARKAGYNAGVHWLTDTPGRGWDVTRHGGRQLRRYAVFEKGL